MTTATKSKRTKGIREYTDPARPPKCNVYCEPHWNGERWERRLNRRGQLKMDFWFASHGVEGRKIVGLLRKMHPAAFKIVHAGGQDAFDEAVSELWAEAVCCLMRWDSSRCRFQTVLGWGVKAVGSKLIHRYYHPSNEFHMSFTFTSELEEAESGDWLMERAATDRFVRDQEVGTPAERMGVWDEVRLVLANNPKAVKVMCLRYGRGYTLREVAEVVGVTKERVRQIEAESLRLIRKNSNLGTMTEAAG